MAPRRWASKPTLTLRGGKTCYERSATSCSRGQADLGTRCRAPGLCVRYRGGRALKFCRQARKRITPESPSTSPPVPDPFPTSEPPHSLRQRRPFYCSTCKLAPHSPTVDRIDVTFEVSLVADKVTSVTFHVLVPPWLPGRRSENLSRLLRPALRSDPLPDRVKKGAISPCLRDVRSPFDGDRKADALLANGV
jgi:hypothetical protein